MFSERNVLCIRSVAVNLSKTEVRDAVKAKINGMALGGVLYFLLEK